MGFGDWIKDIISVPEDNEEDIQEQAAEEKAPEPQKNPEPTPRVKPFTPREAPQTAQKYTTNIKVVLAKPESFEDGRTVADHLNAKRTVVLNLEGANKELCRRLIDFLSGVAYANGGQVKRVANCTYIIAPHSVDVMGDMILDELGNSEIYSNV